MKSIALLFATAGLVLAIPTAGLRAEPIQDARRIEELERRIAELERRLRAVEGQLNGVPIARVGGFTITKHHLNLIRDVEVVRSGGALTDSSLLVALMERAAHEEVIRRFGLRITGEEIAVERARVDKELADKAVRIHAILDPYPGMYDTIVVLPGLASAKVKAQFMSDKNAQQAAYQGADALLKQALADPMNGLSKWGKEHPADYERLDTRNVKDDKKRWMKDFEEKHLKDVKDMQVKNSVIDTPEGYYVARLIDSRKHSTAFEYAIFRKGAMEPWLREQLRNVDFDVTDPAMKDDLRVRPPGHPIVDRIFSR